MGKRWPLDFAGGEFTIHGAPVFTNEISNSGEGTGLTVWDGAVVLSKYLEHEYLRDLAGKVVVEVGAGPALVGLSAAHIGAATVYLTDLPYTHANMADAVKKNRMGDRVHVETLDWMKPSAPWLSERPSFILGSDVVWVEELIAPLLDTLAYLTDPRSFGESVESLIKLVEEDGDGDGMDEYVDRSPVVLIAHQTRSAAGDTALFTGLHARGFEVETVPHEELHPEYRDPVISILRCKRTQLPDLAGEEAGEVDAAAASEV
jgi:hypothetical protein